MNRAFLFPGQGSQKIGMGKDLYDAFPEAKAVFQEVDEALGQDLSGLIFTGEESDLNLTENTQPALMAVSMAVMRTLEAQGGFSLGEKCDYVMGHSLGEYSALTAAGALSISDAAKLLKLRGQAMQSATPVGVGAMAAIIGLDFDVVEAVAAEAAQSESCSIANDNSNGQVVLSGHTAAIERACDIAKDKGAKRALLLPVSAPFHCPLMQPAADKMQEALSGATINAPSVPVIANVTADETNEPEAIRGLLVDQVTGMVRWRESVSVAKNKGVGQMVELGAGKVLCGLVRRIESEIETTSAETPEQIEALLGAL